MSMTFGCAIVTSSFWDRVQRKKRDERLLRTFGFTRVGGSNGPFDIPGTLGAPDRISVFRCSRDVDIWFGWPIGLMLDTAFNDPPQLENFDALMIAHEKGSDRFVHQYFHDGQPGDYAATSPKKDRVWHSIYYHETPAPPRSPAIAAGLVDLVQELGLSHDTLRYCLKAPGRKGTMGVGYSAAKGEWVRAKELPRQAAQGPEMMTEISTITLRPIGKPFEKRNAPGTRFAFLTQNDIIYEIHHRAIAHHLGVRLDEMPEDHPLFRANLPVWTLGRIGQE